MKSIFLFTIALFGFVFTTTAQEIAENAIGLRLGDSRGLGAEISYQRAFLENNRLELDFGFKNGNDYNGIKAVALFQWIKPIQGDFNWYFGGGVGFSSYKHDGYGNNDYRDSSILVVSDVGVEYKFDFPLLLSLDVRPELGNHEDNNGNSDLDLDFDVGVSARYTF